MISAQGATAELGAGGVGFSACRLEGVFNTSFHDAWRTVLEGGAEEPCYCPAADETGLHRIYYRHDYFASALHEVAHWCIAGKQRRLLPDFGYWYAPDGRTPQQQREFEVVEAKPQALEWFFAMACGYRFRVSSDNLGAGQDALATAGLFKQQVLLEARNLQRAGLPARARLFFDALAVEFDTHATPSALAFELAELD